MNHLNVQTVDTYIDAGLAMLDLKHARYSLQKNFNVSVNCVTITITMTPQLPPTSDATYRADAACAAYSC